MRRANSPRACLKLFFVLVLGFNFVDCVVSSINKEGTNVALSSSLHHGIDDVDHIDFSGRQLALGDFKDLNDIFKNAIIRLPDAVIRSGRLEVSMRNTRCTDIEVGDIRVEHKRESDSKVTFRIDVLGLGMNCFLDYRFERILISGRGSADLRSFNNEASIVTAFTSPADGSLPPSNAYVESCSNSINIDDMDFNGEDIWSFILDTIERMLRTTVENEAEKAICEELDSLRTTYDELLQAAQSTLAQYPSEFDLDPLTSETNLNMPDNVKLLDLQEDQTTLAKALRTVLDEAVEYLTKESADVVGDMNVNAIIRDYLLDNGAFTLNLADLPFGTDGVIFKGHDKLTKTTISLESVQLVGLDTLKRFDPVVTIGKATLQSELAWKYLGFELELLIDISPSTLDDSYVAQPGSANIMERVKVKFGVNNPSAVASFLLAIDENALEAIQIGQLLKIDNLLPCIMSTIFAAEVSGLSVDFTDIEPPTLENFVSPGIDRVVSKSVRAAYLMYKSSLLEAVPNFFHTTMRKILNEEVALKFMSEVGNSQCPFPNIIEGVDGITDTINLQDLFLRSEPYGDLLSKAMGIIEERFLRGDGTNLPGINSVVASLTKSQSGVEGQFLFPGDMFNITTENITKPWSYLLDKVELRAFNMTIQNLDTLTPPLSFLEAIKSNILSNRANFGSVRFGMNLLLALEGETSPLNMRNEIELSIIVPSSSFVLDILADIQTKSFLEFPLGDVTNLHCWLATVVPSSIQQRFQRGEGENPHLALSAFMASFTEIIVDAQCISCTSPGGQALPVILDILEEAGVWSALRLHAVSFLEEIVWSYWDRLETDHLLAEAPLSCPHHPRYNESVTPSDFVFSGSTALTRRATETVAMFGVIAIEVALVVTAKSHLLRPVDLPTDPLSGQLSLEIPSSTRILDWTSLEANFGEWASTALDSVRKYLGQTTEVNKSSTTGIDLGANILVRNLFLDSSGVFALTFDDLFVEELGLRISLGKIEIHGLDSMTKADTFNIIAPQTFKHHIKFESLSVKAYFNILPLASMMKLFHNDSESLVLTFGMKNIELDFASLIAFDMDRVSEIELGALLEIERIIPCLFSGIHDLNIPQLALSVQSIEDATIEGIVTSSAENTTSSLLQTVFNSFRADFSEALPIFFDTTLRESINGLLRSFRNEQVRGCRSSLRTSGIVDFRELFLSEPMSRTLGGKGDSPYGDLFRSLNDYMNKNLMQTGDSGEETSINKLVKYLTEKQSNVTGEIAMMGVVLDANSSVKLAGLEADIEIKVSNLKARNLDSIGAPIELLQVASEDTLDNMFSFGVGSVPARLSGRLLFVMNDYAGMQLRNEVDVDLSLQSISLFLRILLRIYEEPLFTLPIRDFSNLNCWLATAIPNTFPNASKIAVEHVRASLQEYSVSIGNLSLAASCTSCTSPNFDNLIVYLFGKDLRDQVTEQVDQVLGSDFVQVLIDRVLNDAARSCPQSPLYEQAYVPGEFWSAPSTYLGYEKKGRDKRAVLFNVANAIIAICLTCLVIVAKWIQRRKNSTWVASLSEEDESVLRNLQEMERAKEKALDEMTESMFRSSHIPRHYRYLVPFVMLFTIGLYMGGHLGLLSTIDIEAQLAGETFTIHNFLEFAFIKSTAQAYSNGGSELAVLLFLFSGVWPYVKLCTMLALWFLPPSILSVRRRGDIFLWIDVLARLSMVDLFSVLVVIAAMMIFAGGPDEAMTTENGFYSMKAIVVPRGGFYCLMIAIRVARISARFFLDYHQKIVALASFEYERQHQIKASMHICDIERCINKADGENEHFEDEHSDYQSKSIISVQTPIHVQEQEYEDENGYRVYEDELGQLHHGSPNKRFSCLGGTVGVMLTLVTVATMIAIACILAPTVAFETKNVLAIALDSRKTLSEVISEYSVFRLATVVLQKASFVLGSTGDYIGLGVLLVLGIASAIMFPLINAYVAFRRWMAGGEDNIKEEAPVENKMVTAYIDRFKAYNHLEVYIVAFVIAIWQLGAFSVYAVHYYCDVLEALYTTLEYVGLVEESNNVQCFATQITIPANILIVGGGFLVLLFFFLNKAIGQYKKNKATAQRFVGNAPAGSTKTLETFDEDEDHGIDLAYHTSQNVEPLCRSVSFKSTEENEVEQKSLASLPTEVTSNLENRQLSNTADFLVEQGVGTDNQATGKTVFATTTPPLIDRSAVVAKEGCEPVILHDIHATRPSVKSRQKLASNNTYGIVTATDSDANNDLPEEEVKHFKASGSFYNSTW